MQEHISSSLIGKKKARAVPRQKVVAASGRIWLMLQAIFPLLICLVLVESAEATPAPGLAAAYGFNEGSGTTVGDVSGHGITGNIFGAIWTAGGRYGNALSFNGSSSYVDMGNPALLQITGSMTWSAWVKAAANPPNDGQIVAKSDSTSGWQLKTSPDTGSHTFGVAVSGGTNAFAQRYSATVRSLNVWYHVAGVYNSTARTLDIYVNGVRDNGVLTGTIPASQVNSVVNVNIGRRSGGYYFNGIIDDVRIYNRVLSQAEIQADMNTPVGSPPPTPTPPTPTPTATATPAPGLMAAYGFNEGSGATVGDASGHGINGNIFGATWTTGGRYGNALSFNGSSSYVDMGNPALLQITGSMTWSAWVKAAANPPNDGQIVAKSDSTSGWQLKTSPDTGSHTFGVAVSGGTNAFAQRYSTTVRSLNVWYHVAGVYNSTARTLDIYVNGVRDNGVLTGTIPASQVNSVVNVNIGRRSGGYYFNGIIDDVRIYNRVLSQAEIQADMNTPVGSPPPTPTPPTPTPTATATPAPGLMAAYGFNEGSGATVGDASGHGINGNIFGATWTTGGRYGNALSFNGSSSYVDMGNPALLQITGSMTWSAW